MLSHSILKPCRLFPLIVGFSFASLAQGPRERPRIVVQALDANHDGILSPEEIQAAPAALQRLDRNGDGELTFDELEPLRNDATANADQLVTQLMAFDKNGDGVLTPDELPERLRPMFARIDLNHDGKLTAEEIRQSASRTGAPGGHRGGPGSAGGMMRLDPVLAALDADHDGILSAQEIRNSAAALQTLDVNHDGTIEAAEMRVRQQTPQERTNHMLDEWDTNKDGLISRDESPDGMRAHFADADKNGDGYLDRSELMQMFAAQAAPTVPAQPAEPQPATKGQPK